jgi:hypothetical protein
LPEPEIPVNATNAFRGTSTSTSPRLCSRAPRTRTHPSSAGGWGRLRRRLGVVTMLGLPREGSRMSPCQPAGSSSTLTAPGTGLDPSNRPVRDLLRRWRRRLRRGAASVAEGGGVAAQGSQAAAVAAAAEFLVELLGAVTAFFPPLMQVGQVRVQEAGPRGRGAGVKAAGVGGGGRSCGPGPGRG